MGAGSAGWLAGGLAVASVILIPVAAYAPWHTLKSDQPPARLSSGADLPGVFARSAANTMGRDGPSGYVRKRLGTVLLLLHLPWPGEALLARSDTAVRAGEDLRWATFGTYFNEPQCGLFDLTVEGRAKVDTILGGRSFCQPVDGSGFWTATAKPSYYLGGATSVRMSIGTVWAVARRRELLAVLVLPWGWVAMYTLTYPIDRYSIPVWPYKSVFSIVLVFMTGAWVLTKIRGVGPLRRGA